MAKMVSRAQGRRADASRAARRWGMRWRAAQAAVEYLLTTLILVTLFAGLYGFLQNQLRGLFILAGTKILKTYY